MLVLSRRAGDAIVLPTLGVRIKVLQTDNRGVKIGIDAPKEIRILRSEVADKYADFEFCAEICEQTASSIF